MAGQGKGQGSFEKKISCLKYTLYCFIAICLAVAIAVIALSVWLLIDTDIQEWIQMLEVPQFYIGCYILLISGLIVFGISIFGWIGAKLSKTGKLQIFAGLQGFCFLVLVGGSAVLLAFGTRNSAIQPLMRNTMRRLIMKSYDPRAVEKLRIIQETIGCCGADGANDYIILKKPLPAECRDTVTGNAFFYGCVEEFTSFLEDKTAWLAALALTLGLFQVVNLVMALVLSKILREEKKELTNFKK